MAQRVTGTNNNYKLYARIRPTEYPQKMMEIVSDQNLTIRDPSQKGSEKQQFSFNGIFDSKCSQEQVWSHTTEPILQKLIEGHNGVVLSYGQTGAGKSFTIFGEDERYSVNATSTFSDNKKDKRGIICQTVEYLFRKAEELNEIREFVLTCSLAEIYLNQVRDLGKAYLSNPETSGKNKALTAGNVMNTYENENLQIKESTNGQVIIQDLTQVTLNSMQNLYDLLSAGFMLRDKFETKGSQIWARAHTIFTLNLVQKDKETDNIPFLNSTVQFVDLAGSERIAKSLTEGIKFQEAILINSSLTSLSKCLQMISKSSKSVPYRDTQLTKILQNCMTYSSHTILFINLNPSESNYEECLSSLQYGDRTKNVSLGQKQQQIERQSITEEFVMNVGGGFPGSDKVVKKLQEEVSDLKSKLEFNNREHKEKLQKIQELLDIDVDLDKVLNKSSQKELFNFKVQKEAMVKLENIMRINKDLEHKIDKQQNYISELQSEERIKDEVRRRMKIEQEEEIKILKDKLSQNRQQNETEIQKLNNEREKEIKDMIERSNQLLEEKASMILNLPQDIERKTQENQKINEVKKATQYEIEKQSKVQIDNLKIEYQKLLENTKEQYEYFLKLKNNQMDEYVDQLKKYREKKTQQVKELNIELQDLYDIIQKQNQIILKIETGQYSGGIRSLFQILDKSHLQNTMSRGSKTRTGQFEKQDLTGSLPNQLQSQQLKNESQLQQQRSFKQTKEKELYDNLDDLVDLQVNINKIVQGKQFDQFDNLKVYTTRIKESLQQSLMRERDLKKRVLEFEEINSTVDIKSLLKEREEYKSKYLGEIKKHNMSRVTIESQKRLISAKYQNSYINNNNSVANQNLPSVNQNPSFGMMRPSTVGDRRFKSSSINFMKQ